MAAGRSAFRGRASFRGCTDNSRGGAFMWVQYSRECVEELLVAFEWSPCLRIEFYFPNVDSLYFRCYEAAGYEGHLGDIVTNSCNLDKAEYSVVLDNVVAISRFYDPLNAISKWSYCAPDIRFQNLYAQQQPFRLFWLPECGGIRFVSSPKWRFLR